MGGKASKKRSAGSTTLQSGLAPVMEPLASGDQKQAWQSTEPERVDSNTRGDYTESSEADLSSTQAKQKEVVEASNAYEEAAVITATGKKTPCVPHDDKERIEYSHGLAFREIFVQYIPGKPHALTKFGAFLYSRQGRHEFKDLDGTGLARTVGLRNRDELLSINTLRTDISNANQLAVLECFSDIGTQIGLVIKRKEEETWLFAFHLNDNGNRPVVGKIFMRRLDSKQWKKSLQLVIPVDSAFGENPVYSYDSSLQVQMQLQQENDQQENDRFLEIDDNMATYVLHRKTVTLNTYQGIFDSDDSIPVSISRLESSDSDSDNGSDSYCDRDDCSVGIKAVDVGPLSVVAFPRYMTRRLRPIPQNNMFFIMSVLPNGAAAFKAVNTQEELYISSDGENATLSVASQTTPPSRFFIVVDGKLLKTRENFLKLFKARGC